MSGCRSGTHLGYLTLLGIMLGVWRGYVWLPGGFAHRSCFEMFARDAFR